MPVDSPLGSPAASRHRAVSRVRGRVRGRVRARRTRPATVRATVVRTATVLALLTATTTACAGPEVAPAPAPLATAPACRNALALTPARVLGLPRRDLDTAGAAAWGDPAVVLRCGLPEPAPTTRHCLTVDGVDWVVDETSDPVVFTSYGRSPTLEVLVPLRYGRSRLTAAVVDLRPVAAALPRTTRRCL